jgi:P27 family predicted phage terminase small subunit
VAGNGNSGGRNIKSPEEHRRLGTFQKVRHEGFETPEPPKGKPTPPSELSAVAQAEWDRMVARMEQSKTSSIVDDAALYQYVNLYSEVEQISAAKEKIEKLSDKLKRDTRRLHGRDLVDAIKEIVNLEYLVAKHLVQLRQGHAAIRQFLVEFGMTPAARGRVKIQKEQRPTSKLIAFTGGKPNEEKA